MSLPKTHKALVLSERKDPLDLPLQELPTPTAGPGSAIIKVLSCSLRRWTRLMYNGTLPYPMSLPLIPGAAGVGRVAEVGPDSIALEPGQLVLMTYQIRARDDPDQTILQGGFLGSAAAAKLSTGEWRNGSLAEYIKVPLENVFPLNETRLIKELGYTIPDLSYAHILLVPFGGYIDTDVKPGDSVLVAPATGEFGAAAVAMALALGARVIAAGRNEEKLKSISEALGPSSGGRLSYVKLTGDIDADSTAIRKASPNGKGIDVYIDFSPHEAKDSPHIQTGFKAMKIGGQVSLMGGMFSGITFPYDLMVIKSLQVKGKFMYGRDAVVRLIGLMEAGLLKVGPAAGIKLVGPYGLDKIHEAIAAAEAKGGWGTLVSVTPDPALVKV